RGSALRFDSQAGLGSLEADDRQALRAAVIDRLPPAALVLSGGDGTEAQDGAGASDGAETADGTERLDGDFDAASEGARLVRLLRHIGRRGGIPLADRSELDAGISLYLFANEPVAVRLRKMRQLLSEGVDAHELRTLEDLRNDLAKASQKTWDVKPAGNRQRRARDGKGRGGDGPRAGACRPRPPRRPRPPVSPRIPPPASRSPPRRRSPRPASPARSPPRSRRATRGPPPPRPPR